MGRHSADKIGPTQLGSFHHRGSSVIPAQPYRHSTYIIQCMLVIIYKGRHLWKYKKWVKLITRCFLELTKLLKSIFISLEPQRSNL